MREKIHYVIEAALAVAVIIIFILHFKGDKTSSDPIVAFTSEEKEAENMPVAFIDLDSLVYNYTYAIDLNEQLMKFIESAQLRINTEERKFVAEVEDYQKKASAGIFTNERRATVEEGLSKKQEELEKLRAQLSQEVNERQINMNETIVDAITTQLKEYNKSKGYHFIFAKTANNILYANVIYDITVEVIEYLNMHYAANPQLKPTD